ncbi:MAG: trypsin-like peptidase domain-containing protein, partial [Clostridia bacterium]|nr:trypsin-like peptidase domain-containing protein [Clostridia bacterium]
LLGDSSTLIPGQAVVAIGNPLGTLGGSITSGIISSPLERKVEIGGIQMNLIQSSTPVSPGNSGGGLFNMYGELVGIVNAKYASENVEGISFSIPMKSAVEASEQLIEKGYVSGRATIGLTFTRTLYKQLNGESAYYLYVESNAHHDDALGENQILKGDRITHIDGKAVSDIADIRSALVSKKTDGTETVKVTVMRSFLYAGVIPTERSLDFTLPCTEYKGEAILVSASDIIFY